MHTSANNTIRRRLTAGAKRDRRGTVYVAVLGVAMIASMVGVAALHVERANLRAAAGRERAALAQLAANSAVELALARIKADPNWRTTFIHNQEVPLNSWTPLGAKASFKFVLIDSDSSLSNDPKDPVTVRGIGTSGDASYVTTVVLEPGRPGLSCLDVGLHSAGQLTVANGSTFTTDQPASSGNQIVIGLIPASSINGDAWSTGSIFGSVSGTKYTNQTPARDMPVGSGSPNMFSYYMEVGTWIDIDSIPSNRIEEVVLSASSNPYGEVNPQGIYLIYCDDETLRIRDARIHGTLVVFSPNTTMEVENTIHWEPAGANYPAMIVWGDLRMNWDGGTPLSEVSQARNFNPTGTPYVNVEDADLLDVYPGVIKGLVYVSGDLEIDKPCVLEGNVVVGGTTTTTANVNLTYSPSARDFPPPGFGRGTEMRVVPGSWRRTERN